MVQSNNLRNNYLENGFVVIKSMFSKDHISNLRPKMIDLSEIIQKNDKEIFVDEDVQNLLLSEKLIKKIKEILNTDKLLYFSDSGIVNHIDPFKAENGYHNDARNEDHTINYENEYPIIRVGIYFENFKDFSGGLKLKERSHKHFCFTFRTFRLSLLELIKVLFSRSRYNLSSFKLGKSINLEIEQGDVVIWNLRTHHCGTSRRLKLFPKLCLQPHIEKLLPNFLYLPTQYKKNRCAMFATFAKKDLSDSNILGYLNLKTNLNRIKQIKMRQNLLKLFYKFGLELPNSS